MFHYTFWLCFHSLQHSVWLINTSVRKELTWPVCSTHFLSLGTPAVTVMTLNQLTTKFLKCSLINNVFSYSKVSRSGCTKPKALFKVTMKIHNVHWSVPWLFTQRCDQLPWVEVRFTGGEEHASICRVLTEGGKESLHWPLLSLFIYISLSCYSCTASFA